MDNKLALDPNIILKAYKALGGDAFVLVMLAAAYYVKYHKKLPNNFNVDVHPEAYSYFSKHIQPILDGKPDTDTELDETKKEELLALISKTTLLDAQEIKTLKDMLDLWWNRKGYSRTEMIYTQNMALNRTGIEGEKFAELRKWLKAEECLTWENRPYGDYLTSYHTFNEAKLYQLFSENQ